MTKKFFIIRAQVRSCRRLMYFTGYAAAGGSALFSTRQADALPFLRMEDATTARLAVAPQNSQLEEIDTINYVPPPEKKKDANGFSKLKN